jgi:bifunctional ADP-heptose synthase (sugar kinase/adenylyltransferase)
MMLTDNALTRILEGTARLRVGVLGDLFLDRYLDLDAALTEPSLETGLDAYQVVRVRSCPGAAGTVLNNLAALGAKEIHPLAVLGDDGEGYELRQALSRLPSVRPERLCVCAERRTPTYTKPMLWVPGQMPRELNRLDIKNRTPLSAEAEQQVLAALEQIWSDLDVLLVLDQVSEPECGVVTSRVRDRLAVLAAERPERIVLADSRERIGMFRKAWLKPNERECLRALGVKTIGPEALLDLSRRCGRPVFCTQGEKGMLVADARAGTTELVASYPVAGPIDTVGAGDSSSAALACALACEVSLGEAAAFANLIASITIQQIGTTGTASPAQVKERWREVRARPA